MADLWAAGNANRDGAANGHWFLGSFIDDPAGLRSTDRLEVKWGVHPRGQERTDWAASGQASTLSILVRGRFRITFRRPGGAADGQRIDLAEEGDYAVWGPDVEHTWRALEDSVVLTVRWPVGAGGMEDGSG